jgi:glycosyltransferase involved in cell wall biosynthesis
MPTSSSRFPIVVHCHLRWSFVWQRPQQIHARLAREHPVLFIEEPEAGAPGEAARLLLEEPWPNVTVARPRIPARLAERGAASPETEATVLDLLREALGGPLGRRFADAVHWLYTPMMEPQLEAFEPAAVVYDCMDELARFRGAPADLRRRERRLLERADVVFTGGWELHRVKSALHPNVHAFGCGVDFDHFHAVARGVPAAEDLAPLPRPRLGYVGVVDERLDYDLVRALARELPGASVVFVGPTAKVDRAALPNVPNVHWLGGRPYADLPRYLAGFDVCLMPFADNEATEFINPTKTLEYLATGRPVLSTPVRDVVRSFSHAVHVEPPATFPRGVLRVLGGERRDPEAGLRIARQASWERVVDGMLAHVDAVLEGRGGLAAATAAGS